MKIKGQILLEETAGRKDPWVKKQLAKDYFLTLKITHVDDVKIETTQDFFNQMQSRLPEITLNGKKINQIFTNITLPPNARPIPNIALANFPDFRINRSPGEDLDIDKVLNAEILGGKEVSFDALENDLQLVIATDKPAIKQLVSQCVLQFNQHNAAVETASTVGINRDAILSIKPNAETQTVLRDISRTIFGNDFVLWNAKSQPVPYHLSIAQSNQMIEAIQEVSIASEDVPVNRPSLV